LNQCTVTTTPLPFHREQQQSLPKRSIIDRRPATFGKLLRGWWARLQHQAPYPLHVQDPAHAHHCVASTGPHPHNAREQLNTSPCRRKTYSQKRNWGVTTPSKTIAGLPPDRTILVLVHASQASNTKSPLCPHAKFTRSSHAPPSHKPPAHQAPSALAPH